MSVESILVRQNEGDGRGWDVFIETLMIGCLNR